MNAYMDGYTRDATDALDALDARWEPKEWRPEEVKVKYHHEDSGNCLTTFISVGEEKHRYFNRFDSGGWYTTHPSRGYWESDCLVRDGVEFVVVDKNGNTLFTEHNGSPVKYQTIRDRAKQFAKEWGEKLHLQSYDEWKRWLSADMEKHGYSGYVDNWLYAETSVMGTEVVGSYEHLGLDFHIVVEKLNHIISGKKWQYVYIYNATNGNTEALCGYIFDEEGAR